MLQCIYIIAFLSLFHFDEVSKSQVYHLEVIEKTTDKIKLILVLKNSNVN